MDDKMCVVFTEPTYIGVIFFIRGRHISLSFLDLLFYVQL